MARGERAAGIRNKGIDYWAKRPGNRGGSQRCAYSKKKTHRLERRAARKQTKEID